MNDQFMISIAIIISSTLMFATPLIYASLGAVVSENAGIVNIGIEGMMVIGAFFASTVAYFTGNPWLAFFCGGLAGATFGFLHGIATVKFNADHVISGIAINLLAPGLSLYLCKLIFDGSSSTPPIENKIPRYFDGVFAQNSFMDIVVNTYFTTYLAFIFVGLVWYILYKTRIGLRVRAVGEHPQSVDTLGINVYKIKYMSCIASGFFAGIAGASMSLALVSSFRPSLVCGQGFIAIAAMILGRWTPQGAMLGTLFFGFCSALIIILGNPETFINISPHLLSLIPYLSTLILLIFIGNKYNGPAANGVPYVKGSR